MPCCFSWRHFVILFRERPFAVSTKRPLVSTGDVRLMCGRISSVVGCPVSWQTAILLTGVAKPRASNNSQVLTAFSQSALLSDRWEWRPKAGAAGGSYHRAIEPTAQSVSNTPGRRRGVFPSDIFASRLIQILCAGPPMRAYPKPSSQRFNCCI